MNGGDGTIMGSLGRAGRLGAVIALVTAAVVLVDRTDLIPGTRPWANVLYTWSLLLAAFGVILGAVHLGWFHLQRVLRGQREWLLSAALLVALGVTVGLGLLDPAGIRSLPVEWIFDAVLAPGQATLFALSGLFLLTAIYRFLRLDRPGGLWILLGLVLVAVAQAPWPRDTLPPLLLRLADWLLVWPVMAAWRGVLLGSALAALLVGLRFLLSGKEQG